MSDFDNIGKLMHLPLADIEPAEKFFESEFIISAAAEAVKETGGRNWVPLIVQEVDEYKYQVVSNKLIYAVAKKAELNRVWCIVVEPDKKSIEQAKILAKEVTPKVNLCTASKETIIDGLKYLINEPGSALKTVDAVKAANLIAAANRENWSNFNPIVTLKCGITKAKLDALAKVFYLLPTQPATTPPPPPEPISIKRASRDEIFSRLDYLSSNKIGGFEAVNPDEAADVIFSASKGKWKSLTPISTLECGIDKQKIKAIKTVFTL